MTIGGFRVVFGRPARAVGLSTLAFIGVSALWVYAVYPTDLYENELLPGLLYVAGLIYGILVRRWWAPLVALVLPILALPLGIVEGDESPAALGILVVQAPVVLISILVGVGLGRVAAPRFGSRSRGSRP